jgi:hypothetical protein
MARRCKISFFVALLLSLFSRSECFFLSRAIIEGGSYNRCCLVHPPLTMIYKFSGVMKPSTCYIIALKALEDDDSKTVETKLSNLGYTNVEIERAKPKKEELNVQVNLLPDIDSVTLTAVGFALIAFNFFILGNLEDGGIAGIVATIINTVSQ